MYRVVIIGGTDGFGKWLSKYILDNFRDKISLVVTGRNIDKGNNVSLELGCEFSSDNLSEVQNADIVIFCVPIAYMENTIKDLAPHVKTGGIILDVTSIKKGPSKALNKYSKEGVLVIPTHPMFGPYISTIAGQIFVLTPEEYVKKDIRYISLKNFLSKQGGKVIEASPVEHDKMMAVVQGLTHFDMFVLGETIKRLGIDIEKSMNFVSPIYKIMISSVARYMNQNPKLYGDIQMFNDEVLEVHKVFMKVSDDFNKFVELKDEESFINTIKGTHSYFGDNSKKGQIYTDKIIYLMSKQIELIEKNIGNEVELCSIYNSDNVKGKIEKFENNIIYLDNGCSYDIDGREIKIK